MPRTWSIGVPYVIPVAGGKAEPLPFASGGSATGLAWLPEGRRLLVTLVSSLQSDLYLVDIDSSDAGIAVATGDSPGTIAGWPSVSADGSSLAFIRTDSSHPPEIWHGTLNGDTRSITDLNPWTRDYPLPEVREISWRSNDGLEIFGLLYLPLDFQEGRPCPLLTHIHGGPMGAWTHRFYASWHDWAIPMTQRGYAVFMPNPRGSSGRGPKYLAANQSDLGGKEWEDIETGIDEVIRLGVSDPDQLVVGGWSYGGYMTSWAVTQTRRFKAAIAGATITNWTSFHGVSTIHLFDSAYYRSDPFNADGIYTFRSPIFHVRNTATPVLFLHGEQDPICPPGQAHEMWRALS
jgi:dipeptidyl aminopeptidase/acylaminoacyl peptidase